MTDVEATYEGFLASRRSGRRNAVQIETATGEGASDLSKSLAQLNINKSADEEDAKSSEEPPSQEEETQDEGS